MPDKQLPIPGLEPELLPRAQSLQSPHKPSCFSAEQVDFLEKRVKFLEMVLEILRIQAELDDG